jgi:hypothetical protein
MSNVVQLDTRKPPSFRIDAEMDDLNRWAVGVAYYDQSIPEPQVYREVSEALVEILGGLLAAAEGMEPSKRGMLLTNIGLYEDGSVCMHCPYDMSDDMRRFILVGIEQIKIKIRGMSLKTGNDQ